MSTTPDPEAPRPSKVAWLDERWAKERRTMDMLNLTVGLVNLVLLVLILLGVGVTDVGDAW